MKQVFRRFSPRRISSGQKYSATGKRSVVSVPTLKVPTVVPDTAGGSGLTRHIQPARAGKLTGPLTASVGLINV